jgi:hypothetical protein
VILCCDGDVGHDGSVGLSPDRWLPDRVSVGDTGDTGRIPGAVTEADATSRSGRVRDLVAISTVRHCSNMGSNSAERTHDPHSWTPPPPPAIARFASPARVPPVKPVWVLLDRLVAHDPTAYRSVPNGLDFTGRARGLLKAKSRVRSSREL